MLKHSGGLDPKGTFWFFTAVTVIGGLWVLITIPESAGRSLESMDRLFELPWYKIGLFGNKHADLHDQAVNEKEAEAERQGSVEKVDADRVEKV